MRRREYYWSLYHLTEQNQLSDLRTDQVEAVFAAIPRKNRAEWLVWREGFQDWMPFENFPDFLKALRQIKDAPSAPKPPPITQTAKGKKQVSSGSKTSIMSLSSLEATGPSLSLKETTQDERDHARFKKKFQVKLIYGRKFFVTTTLDISLKGMRVKDPLPSDLPRFFNAEVKTNQGLVSLVCSVVPTEANGRPSRLKIESNDFVHVLQSALFVGS